MALIYLSGAWLIGIYLGTLVPISGAVIALGLLPGLLIPLFSRRYLKPLVLVTFSLLVLMGAAAYSGSRPSVPTPIASYNGSGLLEIRGTVNSPAEVSGQYLHLNISAEEINQGQGWRPTAGTILLYTALYPEYHYGDRLWISGFLEAPPVFADFDYQAYLAKEGVYSTMLAPTVRLEAAGQGSPALSAIYSFRSRLADSLSQALPEPQSSLAEGILLGIRSSIPEDLKADLSTTGTAQLLAISGLNLTIVAGLLIALGLRFFGRRHFIYLWLALALIWFYTVLTGVQPPVLRAAIMATVFLIAEFLGRQKNAHVALAFSAAIMVAVEPQVLAEASFQLSFLSMLGLVLITPVVQKLGRRVIVYWWGEEGAWQWICGAIWDSFSVTIGALLLVWPLVAYYFGLVSIVGPVANLIIAPALPLIILTAALSSLIGLSGATAAPTVGWISWVPVSYMIWMTQAMAALPMASVEMGRASLALVLGYYPLLLAASWLAANIRITRDVISTGLSRIQPPLENLYAAFERTPKKLIVVPLLVLVLPLSIAAFSLPDDKLHVSFLDVGEGDAILIQSGAQNILVDGGPDPQAVIRGLSSKMKFWQRKIDLMVLTHPHLDHLTGLVEVLQRYQVGQVLAPQMTSDSATFSEWRARIIQAHIPVADAIPGKTVALPAGVRLTVLSAEESRPPVKEEEAENQGLVLRLSQGRISFLLTADIDQSLENSLISRRADLSSTVLKVAHHGSGTASTSQFLSRVNPQAAVISVGLENRFGHPDPAMVRRLANELGQENRIYRTDRSGTIEFTSDGKRLWVKSEKP